MSEMAPFASKPVAKRDAGSSKYSIVPPFGWEHALARRAGPSPGEQHSVQRRAHRNDALTGCRLRRLDQLAGADITLDSWVQAVPKADAAFLVEIAVVGAFNPV
jgi:hypothetical protein